MGLDNLHAVLENMKHGGEELALDRVLSVPIDVDNTGRVGSTSS